MSSLTKNVYSLYLENGNILRRLNEARILAIYFVLLSRQLFALQSNI